MTNAYRTFYALTTAAILVIGTLQMAYASGQAPAVGEMELCTGHGAVTVGIDADGNPTGEIFYCPECASTALIVVETGTVDLPACCVIATKAVAPPESHFVTLTKTLFHPARGPPVSV